jgi:integrase
VLTVPASTLEEGDVMGSSRLSRAARGAPTVAAWFEQWPRVADVLGTRSQKTIEHTLNMASPFAEEFGDMTWEELGRQRLVFWAASHQGTIRWARTILQDAVTAGLVDTNPLQGIRQPRSTFKVTPPTAEEVALLADHAGALGPMVLCAAYSGLRAAELRALQGVDLWVADDELGRIYVRDGKGGKPRVSLLFEPGLSAALESKGDRVSYVFRRRYRAWDSNAMKHAWLRARAEVGLTTRFHDLRHFHATWLLDRGATADDVAVQLGHSSPALIYSTYGHPSREKALGRLAAIA